MFLGRRSHLPILHHEILLRPMSSSRCTCFPPLNTPGQSHPYLLMLAVDGMSARLTILLDVQNQ